jgi:hypothetical protein
MSEEGQKMDNGTWWWNTSISFSKTVLFWHKDENVELTFPEKQGDQELSLPNTKDHNDLLVSLFDILCLLMLL